MKFKFNRKTVRKLYFKLVKQSGSPDSVARGVAIGLFIGFLIPFGGQSVVAFGLAFLLKARKIPALAFTWVTNPYTILFIYPIQCYIGSFLVGSPLSREFIQNIFSDFFKERTLAALLNLGEEILIPFFAGGALIGAISAFIGYFATYGMILRYRQRTEQRLRAKLSVAAHRDHDIT